MDALKLNVGHADIDAIHSELALLVETIAVTDDSGFKSFYSTLLAHTESHFQHEEQLMHDRGYIHAAEHLGEHRQMLNEMRQFKRRPIALAKAYVRQRLPERFSLHISRMDSLLAAYLRHQE